MKIITEEEIGSFQIPLSEEERMQLEQAIGSVNNALRARWPYRKPDEVLISLAGDGYSEPVLMALENEMRERAVG